MPAKYWLTLILLSLAAVTSVGGQAQRTLVVFAAASLANAFEAIADGFEAANPGVEVLFSFGSSAELAAQIAEGAPADVFASANTAQMTNVQNANLLASAPVAFARNRLTLIVPDDNPAGIESLADLSQPGLLLVVAAPGVPVREYTEQMLALLAEDAAFGPDYIAAFRANIASEEPNVRQVAAKVALGEADAGIVYISDVTPDLREPVVSFEIPDRFVSLAEYPIAVVTGASEPALAQSFIDAVLSHAGQTSLETWGFTRAEVSRRCFGMFHVHPICIG